MVIVPLAGAVADGAIDELVRHLVGVPAARWGYPVASVATLVASVRVARERYADLRAIRVEELDLSELDAVDRRPTHAAEHERVGFAHRHQRRRRRRERRRRECRRRRRRRSRRRDCRRRRWRRRARGIDGGRRRDVDQECAVARSPPGEVAVGAREVLGAQRREAAANVLHGDRPRQRVAFFLLLERDELVRCRHAPHGHREYRLAVGARRVGEFAVAPLRASVEVEEPLWPHCTRRLFRRVPEQVARRRHKFAVRVVEPKLAEGERRVVAADPRE